MSARISLAALLTTLLLIPCLLVCAALACCPAPPSGKRVVNADQTIVMVWDAAAKTQHFIRQASFRSEADDFGFLVPTPAQPELEESGNEAFPYLQTLTEPEVQRVPRPNRGVSCGCSDERPGAAAVAPPPVNVLDQKLVAGYDAVVLEAESADALVDWLKEHGYAFSPEVQAWVKPYVEAGWKITALKVAKPEETKGEETKGEEAKDEKTVAASALRMSFKTDQPLFPYREPDPGTAGLAQESPHRLLRIYFLAESRFDGRFSPDVGWSGTVAWANLLSAQQRADVLRMLKLPEDTGPAKMWLTEFEHDWPYAVAPSDLQFVHALDQRSVKRPPIIDYVAAPRSQDVTLFAFAALVVLRPLFRRFRRSR